MRKLLLFAAMAMAGLSLCLAEDFSSLSFEEELGAEAMEAIDGQMFRIFVPFNNKGMATVVVREKGDYCQFQVPVTTLAAANNKDNRPMNGPNEYKVVPLPIGSYPLGYTQSMSNPAYGKGIHIEATVSTPYVDPTKKPFLANDFFIHGTSQGNTWGCAGVANKSGKGAEMTRVYNEYIASSGSKTITVAAAKPSPAASSPSYRKAGYRER